MSADLALVIPGLEQQLKACTNAGLSLSECPALTNSLKNPQGNIKLGLDSTLTQLFTLPSKQDFPHAALQCFLHSEKNEPLWKALLSPVALIADKDGLLMDTSQQYALQENIIFDEVNLIAQDYDLQLESIDNEAWLLASNSILDVTTTPLGQAQYQRIDTLLPQGKDAIKIRKFMNDCQMTLAYIQQKRQFELTPAENDALPNTFWVHGTGALPNTLKHAWNNIYCNTSTLNGICKLMQDSTPAQANSFNEITVDSNTLVLLENFSQMMEEFNPEDLLKKFIALEENWLQPIAAVIKNKSLASATLYPCYGKYFSIKKESLAAKIKRFCRFRN